MKRRIFICASIKFPKEDAGANRIQYVAKSILQAGYDVYVFSCGRNELGINKGNGWYEYAGITFVNAHFSSSVLTVVERKLFSANKLINYLKNQNPTSNDLVYIYGSNSNFVTPIYKYCKRNKIAVAVDVVEWHQPYQYKYGKLDIRYISNKKVFENINPQIGNIISISKIITAYYQNKGCKNIVELPVMIDSDESAYDFIHTVSYNNSMLNLIYPGNPKSKDDITLMLKGIKGLTDEERKHVKFHITGTTIERVKNCLAKEVYLLDELKNNIIFYGWLPYQELIKLYTTMDFLYMIRLDTLVTQANFPSKLPELMAYGIAPIGNKIGDYYNYITERSSILIEKNIVEECTEALRRAIAIKNNDISEWKRAVRNCAVVGFDYRGWTEKIVEFVERCFV